jgi:hypothetical protein
MLLLLVVILLAVGCKSDAEKLTDEAVERLDEAAKILEEHKGDEAAALEALVAYERSQRQAVDAFRRRGLDILAKLPEEERKKIAEESAERIREARARLENLLRTYDNPKEFVQIIVRLY